MCIPPKMTSLVYDFINEFNIQGATWGPNTTISLHDDYVQYKNYDSNELYRIYPQIKGRFILLLGTIDDFGIPEKTISKNYKTIEEVVQYIIS